MAKTEVKDRDILDDVVVRNQGRNPQVFQSVQNIPTYFGSTKNAAPKFSLKQTKRRKELGKQKLICDIISGTESLQFDSADGKVVLLNEGKDVTVPVHPTIIKFIKTCIACSMTQNEDYNKVVAAMARELLKTIEHINLPIPLPADNKVQKLIAAELNEYLQKICDDTGTKWSEVVTTGRPKKVSGKQMLLDAAGRADA